MEHHVSHTVHGRLRGDLCGDFDEPLAGMVVRLYSAESTDGGRPDGSPAEVSEILDGSMTESRAARLLVEVTTYPDGAFAATLPEHRYDGGAIDVDVYCRTVPGLEQARDKRSPIQVHVTRLQPDWSDEPYREISFERTLPASVWCRVREMFDAWVICGHVVEHKTDKPVTGAAVRAFATDSAQDGPLGTAITDHHGRFRIDYTAGDFKRTPISPLAHVELASEPDLYFQVESHRDELDEPQPQNQKPSRAKVGLCTRVELKAPGMARAPKQHDPAFQERRKVEIASSYDPGRAPIATDGNAYFRPFELLISSRAFERLRTELTEHYGAERYHPNPNDPYWRSRHKAASARDINEQLRAAGIDLQVYVLRRNVGPNDMAKVARALRSQLPTSGEAPGSGIHVNHVVFAQQFYHGGPDGFPWPCDPPLSWPDPPDSPQNIDVAVLDTGVWANWANVHPALQDKVWPDPDDNDLLDETAPPGGLDTCAGHGLFICGLIHRMDGELQIDPGRVLSSIGDGDDASTAVELLQNTAPVINLSFGCHTEDDHEPPTLAQTITTLINSDRVVVAAAGNGGTDREFWPAAMPEVIAVGSWDDPAGTRQRAQNSNYGEWVDVYARGVNLLSSYVDGISGPNGTFKKWVQWSGTSFATPQVAAEIAIRARDSGQPHKIVASNMLASSGPEALEPAPWGGKLYVAPLDLTR